MHNQKPRIFVFYGYKGSGKDTCYEMLNDRYACNRIGFADPVREAVWNLFSYKIIDRERLWGNIEKKEEEIIGWTIPEDVRERNGFEEKYWTGRRLLQWFGTEVARHTEDSVWLEMFKKTWRQNPNNITVVTDCRFDNEYNMLKSLEQEGAEVTFFKVNRDDEKAQTGSFSSHASEQDIAKFRPDVSILNTGTLEDLVDELYPKVFSLFTMSLN